MRTNVVKTIMKSIREYKKPSLLTSVFMVLEVIMEIIIPVLMASMIDRGIDAHDMKHVVLTGVILSLTCIIALIFGTLSGRYGAEASSGLAANLRKDMYYNVQNFSFSNLDKFSTSSIITRLTTDVNNIQMTYQMIIRIAVRSPVMILFALIMSVSINAKISIVLAGMVPVLGIGLYFIIMKVHPVFVRVFKIYDTLNTVVQENLQGMRVVKSYNREDHEVSKFKEVSDKIYKGFSLTEKILAYNMPLIQSSVYASILLISWFGARMIVSATPTLTTGQLSGLITYTMQILNSLIMLSMVLVMIIISRASAGRIQEVLVEQTSLSNPESGAVESVKDGSVCFKNVSFSYSGDKNKSCLSDISLNIKSGDTVGIIGGTGSSKTTLVQLIPRLYDATSGAVYVSGVDVRDYDLKALRDQVAMVLQKNVLFSGTIKENLRWGNENATDVELIRVSKLARAHNFIQSFPDKYDTFIEQGGTNVSGGQKQRLCIARALLKKPKILILDDSTSAVDTKTEALIRRAFLEEIPETTKIIIAQRISSVEAADLIIVMDDGKINGMGTHEQLLRENEIYREVYNSQTKGGAADGSK